MGKNRRVKHKMQTKLEILQKMIRRKTGKKYNLGIICGLMLMLWGQFVLIGDGLKSLANAIANLALMIKEMEKEGNQEEISPISEVENADLCNCSFVDRGDCRNRRFSSKA